MKKTKRLLKDLILLRAQEENYIVLTLVKLVAFIVGVVVGYELHDFIRNCG